MSRGDNIIVLLSWALNFRIANWKTRNSAANNSKHSLTSICSFKCISTYNCVSYYIIVVSDVKNVHLYCHATGWLPSNEILCLLGKWYDRSLFITVVHFNKETNEQTFLNNHTWFPPRPTERSSRKSWGSWNYEQNPRTIATRGWWQPVTSIVKDQNENHVNCPCHVIILHNDKMAGKDASFR